MKPTQDKSLKKYIVKVINEYFDSMGVTECWGDSDIDKYATKILRHLNFVGYVQIPIEKPKIADEQPKPSEKFLADNDEYFTGIMKHKEDE